MSRRFARAATSPSGLACGVALLVVVAAGCADNRDASSPTGTGGAGGTSATAGNAGSPSAGGATGNGTGGSALPGAAGAAEEAGGGTAGSQVGRGGAAGTSDGGNGPGGKGGASGSGPAGRDGIAGASGSGGAPGPLGPLAPAQGALLGAFVGTGTLAQLETTLGRKVAVSHNFVGWNDDYTSWVRSTLTGGRIPLVTWEPWINGTGVSIDDIASGGQDAMIRSRAQAAGGIGQKFFLRWGHEMNGNWYPWDGFHNGASAAAAGKYIAAYRHIHDLFVAAGATNVLWVFCPNVDSVPGDAWNAWSNYYPGDAYVDWMGFDGYNWGTVQTGSTWRSFASIAGTIYAGLAGKAKPIMLAETASTEQGGDKAAWISGIVPALKTSPSIKALVWFHMNKETDWRVDSSSAARDAFVTMARDAYFNP